MEESYITIQEAATVAGFRDASMLHRAARKGTLRTLDLGPRARVTTRKWLQEYLDNVELRGTQRGKPRGRRTDDDTWFYTPEWQAKERAADEDIAAGRLTPAKSTEAFLESLRSRRGSHAHASGN